MSHQHTDYELRRSYQRHSEASSSRISPDLLARDIRPPSLHLHLSSQEDISLGDGKDALSGPQRSKYIAATSPESSSKEKRKRSRVTPDQLSQLEAIFATDRNPTAARRREISDLLGMQERQTQIWFQNRRAKAKLRDCKLGHEQDDPPPDTPPELSAGFQIDLHNLIHESEPVTIIPCTELTIGSWRRIASTVGKYDLVAYVSDSKRCLTWYIYSGGYGFKMVLPFEKVKDTEFRNASPGCGTATFALSEPPLFFAENISPSDSNNCIRTWKRCGDWTEARQASLTLQHTLVGSAVQLSHVLRNLQKNVATTTLINSPSYGRDAAQHLSDLRIHSAGGVPSPGESNSDGEFSSSHSGFSGTSRKRSGYDHYIVSSISSPSALCSPVTNTSPARSTPPSTHYPRIQADHTSFDYYASHRNASNYHSFTSNIPRRLYTPSREPEKLIGRHRDSDGYGQHRSPSLPSTPLLSTPCYPTKTLSESDSVNYAEGTHLTMVANTLATPSMNIHYFNNGQLYH